MPWNAKPNLLSGSYLSVCGFPFSNQPLQVILNGGLLNSIPVTESENLTLSIASRRFTTATLVLALIGLPVLGSNTVAFAEDSEPRPSASGVPQGDHHQGRPLPAPKGGSVATPQGQPEQDDELDEASHKQSQISQKYGDEREVATPPLIVKPAVPSAKSSAVASGVSSSVRETSTKLNGASVQSQRKQATKYVSQPLNVALHQLNQTEQSSISQAAADSQVKAFDAAKNAPVIQNIHRDDLGSPAQEFISKAYFALAITAIFGALLGTYFFRKLKANRGSDQKDGWLDLTGE